MKSSTHYVHLYNEGIPRKVINCWSWVVSMLTLVDPRWPPWCFATSPTSIHKIRSSRCDQTKKEIGTFAKCELKEFCANSFGGTYSRYLSLLPLSRVKQKSLKIWASQQSIIEIRLFCCPCGPCHVRRLMIWDLLAPLISSTSRCLDL